MKWSEEKIRHQKEYFAQQREKATGNFTEFVVRVYYSIYKKCAEIEDYSCKCSDVNSHKIKYIVYEGVYGGVPDHDYANVIDDCVKNLKEMGYIRFQKRDETWFFRVEKRLDFLLPGEHERYMEKFSITKQIVSDAESPTVGKE